MFDPALRGHQALREKLLERLQAERMPGTLLFTGPEAVGKRRVALELAQRELCFRKTACGTCEACRLFKGDDLPVELPNLLRIAPEGRAGLIKIGTVRDSDLVEGGVIRWASLSPPPGCHRWVLVEDAHRLNGGAANMLLKTLEEPPPGTHFLLITHRPEAVIQTIRSRAQRLAFAPLADEDAWAVAAGAGWAADQREAWSALAEGTLRVLDEAAFARARAQVEAWLALGAGASFEAAAEPLIPEKDAAQGQSEQLRPALELLLRILADLGRLRSGRTPALDPWREGLATLAGGGLDLRPPMEAVSRALQSLARNPAPEPLLREMAMQLV
jgi:DNA polymerase-3 subunit delta'